MQANLPLNDGYWRPVASAGHPYGIVDAGRLSKSLNIFLELASAGRTKYRTESKPQEEYGLEGD